ncbi:MAG: NfeD family protein [Opitutales bacterium]
MTTIVFLLIACWILVALEVLLPGGILGLIGLGCLVAAVWMGHDTYGFFGALITLVTGIVGATIIGVILFKSGIMKGGFSLKSSISGKSGPQAAPTDDLTGKRAVAVTALAPSGLVEVEGHQHEGHSQDGFLDRGTQLEVVGHDAHKVLVRRKRA